jgi:poly-gamma-glutamate synthesis protein (capsule biosynthesis protein)
VTTESPAPEIVIAPDTTLLFVGDIMLARGVANSVKKNFNDNFDTFLETIPEIAAADIAFANLEGPISARGKNVGSRFSFRFEPRVAPALKNVGFDIFSVANNHAGDWTLTAFKDTLTYLKEVGIKTAGGGQTRTEAITPSIIEKNGVKFGFIGFTDVGPNGLAATDTHAGLLLASDPDFTEIIKNAKAQVDILIVSFHWGVEYKEHTDRQTLLAHTAIDAGADLVVGHHPHVEQVTEEYKNKLIIYSLGNFIFDQYFSPDTMHGLAVSVIINKDGMVSYEKHRVQLSKTFQPHFETYQER